MTRPMEMICVVNPSQIHKKKVFSVHLRHGLVALIIPQDLEDPNLSCWRAAGVGDDLLYKESVQDTGRETQVSLENNHIALLKLSA